MALPTLEEIESAAALIAPHVPPTPAYTWPLLSEIAGAEVWVKHENHTPVGAFKVRGGIVYLEELLRREPGVRGVIAASTGNHGQSIAWSARRLGLRAVIVVPHGNNPGKNRAMRALGAELVEHGREFQEALEHSRALAEAQGLHAVPSFHPWLVRGVATYGLEFLRAVPDLEAVFVPIGLGSGICGMVAARQALGMKTRLIGVVSAHAPAYALSFASGSLRTQSSATRVAEGVACSTPNPDALRLIQRHVDEIVTVSDDECLQAMRELLECTHNLAEGAGALAWAALKRAAPRAGRRLGCVLSGGNLSTRILAQVTTLPV